MRPKKTRTIKCAPGERCFRPNCKPLNKVDVVSLTLDEFEAIRLSDLEQLYHIQASRLMKVSRSTFSRIVASARKKIADALVNVKAMHIEGGCCEFIKKRTG